MENIFYPIRREVLREEAANVWGTLLKFMTDSGIPYLPKDANEYAAVLWSLAEIRDSALSPENNSDEILDKIFLLLKELSAKSEALIHGNEQ